MRQTIILITVLILGLAYGVQDKGLTQVLNPQFSGANLSIPKSINFQGTLYQDGSPVTDTMDMWFGIYDALSGGTLLYSTTKTDVAIIGGWFSTMLTNIPNSVFPVSGPTRYLEIKAPATQPPLTPRLQLASVGYSYHSITADTAEYTKSSPIARPITPPVSGIEIAKPCTLRANVAFPNAVLNVRNDDTTIGHGIKISHANGFGLWVDSAGMCGVAISRPDIGFSVYKAKGYGFFIDSSGGYGAYIGRTDEDGILVGRAGRFGIYVDSAGNDGVVVSRSGDVGVKIITAADRGLYVGTAGSNGVEVDSAADRGFYVGRANYGVEVARADRHGAIVTRARWNGVWVDSAGWEGIRVSKACRNGLYVGEVYDNGVEVWSAGVHGVKVDNADSDGVYINDAEQYGFHIHKSGSDGVRVDSAGRRGGYFRNYNNNYYALEAINNTGTSGATRGIYVQGHGYATGGWQTDYGDGKTGFALTSPDIDIVTSGSGSLSDGEARITFEKTIREAFSSEVPVKVIITPTSECNGIFLAEASNSGFTAKELMSGKSNATFNWMAIGRMKGYENRLEINRNHPTKTNH